MSILNVARMGKFSQTALFRSIARKSGKLSQSRLTEVYQQEAAGLKVKESDCNQWRSQAGEIRFEAGLKVKESV